LCGPDEQAVDTLSGVLERFVNEYGEKAPECADVYMQVLARFYNALAQRERARVVCAGLLLTASSNGGLCLTLWH